MEYNVNLVQLNEAVTPGKSSSALVTRCIKKITWSSIHNWSRIEANGKVNFERNLMTVHRTYRFLLTLTFPRMESK